MKTLKFHDAEAKEILEEGYPLVFPTETVFGIGVRWDSKDAYERLCEAKKRRPSKAIAVMTYADFDFDTYFDVSDAAKRVMKTFLPGPLTVLVKAKETAPYQTHLGTHIAGIRVPAKKDLLEFLASLPFPLQVTSANMSGEKPAMTTEEAEQIFEKSELVKGIIPGECQSGIPTTVVDLTSDKPHVIREGEIKLAQIEEAFYGK